MKKTVESRLGLSEAVVFCVEGGLVELMLLLLMMMRGSRYPEGRISLPFIGGFPPSACPALLLKCRAVRDSLADRNSSIIHALRTTPTGDASGEQERSCPVRSAA